MLEKLALAPFALQSWLRPSRTSDTILFGLCAWLCGAICGACITAFLLSPGLRRFLLRALSLALQEFGPRSEVRPAGSGVAGTDRLQRYRS